MIEEERIQRGKRIRKRKKPKHRLKRKMKRRVYAIIATIFLAGGIAATINIGTANFYTTVASIFIYLATGVGLIFILFLIIVQIIKGRKPFKR